MVELLWADETLMLLPERAVWWARRRMLLVADLHLGKPAAFRAAGLPVPDGGAEADLARLRALVVRFGAARLVILGDLLHAKAARSERTLEALRDWRRASPVLDVLLVRGNHDTHAGDPPEELEFRVVDEPADDEESTIAFTHTPGCDARGRSTICGHLHPAASLHGPVSSHRAPCFWAGPERLVLPAFGSFTGSASIRPDAADRVFVVGDGEIVEVRTTGARRAGAARR